ncbi:hypothetical protein ACRRTK_019524 [Alexandromys fortis]
MSSAHAPCEEASCGNRASKDSTLIREIFGDSWRSRILEVSSARALQAPLTHPFLRIPLDIEATQSVNEVLEKLAKAEELCAEKCLALWLLSGKDAASKTLTVQTASKVLLMVLNRFSDFMGDKEDRDVTVTCKHARQSLIEGHLGTPSML